MFLLYFIKNLFYVLSTGRSQRPYVGLWAPKDLNPDKNIMLDTAIEIWPIICIIYMFSESIVLHSARIWKHGRKTGS